MELDQTHDNKNLKYVLYARKSTDDAQRQLKSVEHQIEECEIMASYVGLKIIKPVIIEKKSAKRPNMRPLFSKILSDIRSKKYDGIIAWHPDRLARNMKEGGEIIDMIDQGIIKDLRFVTHHFTNDATGKMLLGMSFVLSKQYSDDLSQKVTRGVRHGLKEGRSGGTPKHGYIRTEHGAYVPDGNNFELICEAWAMRNNGQSLRNISDYMNKNGYSKEVRSKTAKNRGKLIKMTPQILSKIFKDPFYYGVLIQADEPVDLRLAYDDFEPAVDEQTYNKVQQMSNTRAPALNKRRGAYYPLKGMIYCDICGYKMYPAASQGYKKYLYYRCDNRLCTRKKKSIRAKIIFNYIYDLLGDGLGLTEIEYKKYLNSLNKTHEADQINKKTRLRSLRGALHANESESNERGLKLIDYKKSDKVWKINNKRLLELDFEAEKIKEDISKLENSLSRPEEDRLTIEKFLNLSSNASSKVKMASEVGKDRICRLIFLNFRIGEEKVVCHLWKEPFATLMKSKKILNGRGSNSKLEPQVELINSILSQWDSQLYDEYVLSATNRDDSVIYFGYEH